jgi:O-antigen/teichoic acid export membrane protein
MSKMTSTKNKLLVALTGSALAQIIHLLFTPVLTRIYSPEDFGHLALLIAFGGIVTAIATGKYDWAIVIAPLEERFKLDIGIKLIAAITSIFLLLLAVIFYLFEVNDYAILTFFLSIIAFFRAIYQSKRALLNSFGEYKEISKGRIVENTSNSLLAIIISFFSVNYIGLMLAKSFSYIIPAFTYSNRAKKHFVNQTVETKEALKKYIKFPRYSIASDLFTQINLSFSIFAFTYLYGQEIAGHISMTTRVLSLPINFIGLSFLDVFREKATQEYISHGSFKSIFTKFFGILAGLAVLGFFIVFIWGEDIFALVLGEQWRTAGELATIAIALYSIRLISSPLGFAFHLTQKQRLEMLFKVLILVISFICIAYAYFNNLGFADCLRLYSYSLTSIYALYTFVAYKCSLKD